MRFEVTGTVGSLPEIEFVGQNSTMMAKFSLAENHNVNEGTKENPNWVTKGTSWYNMQAWGAKAEELMKSNIGVGDLVRIKGDHKINTKQKENEKKQYFNVYTVFEVEVVYKKKEQ
jgi:single-stranded DNA-binding protein